MSHIDHPDWHPMWELGSDVRIDQSARIKATERFVIGDHSTIHENVLIEGRDVEIGQEAWVLPGAIIGGGSCFERPSSLRAGHFLHLGRDTFINTARAVVLGDEVGLGTRTALYTHGAYLSALDGFPVAFAPITIGDRVWLPGATVNPGVTIGSDVVVAVGSVVTHDIPRGSLAGGIPAQVIRQGAYPAPLEGTGLVEFYERFFRDWLDLGESPSVLDMRPAQIRAGGAIFHVWDHRIEGPVSELSERLRDQLRRYGIRFYSRPVDGQYQDWR